MLNHSIIASRVLIKGRRGLTGPVVGSVHLTPGRARKWNLRSVRSVTVQGNIMSRGAEGVFTAGEVGGAGPVHESRH